MPAIAKINVAALADRAKNILMKPEAEWDKINGEKPLLPELFTGYVAILAAIPALCSFVGWEVFGLMGLHPGIVWAFGHMILTYVLAFICVGVGGFVSEFLAAQFGGKADRISAFKLMVYSMTPAWLSGVFSLVPMLSILGIVGLYSLYLFYLGAPKLMGVPKEKAVVYTAVTVIATAIVAGIFSAVLLRT